MVIAIISRNGGFIDLLVIDQTEQWPTSWYPVRNIRSEKVERKSKLVMNSHFFLTSPSQSWLSPEGCWLAAVPVSWTSQRSKEPTQLWRVACWLQRPFSPKSQQRAQIQRRQVQNLRAINNDDYLYFGYSWTGHISWRLTLSNSEATLKKLQAKQC